MKKVSFVFTLVIAVLTLAFTSATVDQKVDTSNSIVNWTGYKVTGNHTGTIDVKSGSFKFENDLLVGGEFEIDMTSINCTDLEGEGKGKLEGHLKSDDFFGVNNFPTAKLVITKVASRGMPGDYKVVGDLTIKETTKEVRFNANIADGNATAKLSIDRSEFGVKYGSGSFFDNLGDKTIYDEFDLEIKLALSK